MTTAEAWHRSRVGLTGALLVTVVVSSCQSGRSESPADSGLHDRIDRYVQQEVDASRIPGVAVAIVQGGEVVHRRGFGHDGHGRPIAPGTPFPIGSLTKSFTALAIRQLSEAGALGLDDPVQRHVPWFRVADADASSRITVRHLLNQTSGFSRAAGIEPLISGSQASVEDIVRGLRATPLNRPVGQSYEYSNLNFVLLGLLVQTASGQPWATYIERHLLAPLGMTSSFTTFEAAERLGMTALHRYWFGVPVQSSLQYQPGLAPAGYLAASVDDMARYLAVYLRQGQAPSTRLLSEAGTDGMLAPATNEVTVRLLSQTFVARYGEGWFVGPFGAAPDARWHLGELPSFAAWMVLLPESNQGVVVLTNIGSQMALAGGNSVLSRLPQGIVNLLRTQPPPRGISVTRFYTLFDVSAAIVLALLIWALRRIARAGPMLQTLPRHVARSVVALVAGLGTAALLLIGPPAVMGTSWTTIWHFVPDLTAVVLTVAILCAACGIMRAVQGTGLLSPRRPPQ